MFHYSFPNRSNIQSNHSPFLVTELWCGKFEFILAQICSDLPHHSILYSPLNYCVLSIGVTENKFQDHMKHTNSDKSWEVRSSSRVHTTFQLPLC